MSAALLNSFAAIPGALVKVGIVLPCDLHIYLATNDHLLLFRKAGSTIEEKDLATIRKLADGALLVAKGDYEKMLAGLRSSGAQGVVADPASPEARATAAATLKNLAKAGDDLGPTATDQEKLEQTKAILDNSFQFVQEVLQKCKQRPSAQSFLDVLQNQNEADPLQRHCRHVSGIAALGLIAIGNASIEDISDIAFAGLLHDLGLSDLPKVLLDKHLSGVPPEALSSAEKMMLMRHTENVFEQLKKNRTLVPDAARRIIEQHHENWGGTGFKGVKGTSIFRAARMLRIADELVSHLQSSLSPKDVTEAFAILRSMRDPVSGESDLDPSMLAVFEQSFW